MKKIIFMCLAFISLSVSAEIIRMDMKNPQKNELFIDEYGRYRFRRAEDIYKDECGDSPIEEVRKKCLEAEKAKRKRENKMDLDREGQLFTGKIQIPLSKGKDTYFYVNQGQKGEEIHLELKRYYYEKGILYDIKTEEPVSDDIIFGGAEGLSSQKGGPSRFLIQQKYENGLPVGDPFIVPVE